MIIYNPFNPFLINPKTEVPLNFDAGKKIFVCELTPFGE